MSRRSAPSRFMLSTTHPHQVALYWDDLTYVERGPVMTAATKLDRAHRSYHASLYEQSYLVVSFSARQTALEFRALFKGEIIDPTDVDKLGHW